MNSYNLYSDNILSIVIYIYIYFSIHMCVYLCVYARRALHVCMRVYNNIII